MTAPPTTIWISALRHPAFQCGGWACVVGAGAERLGFAGGQRQTTESRMALSALATALKARPNGAVRIVTASPELLAFAPLLANLAGAHAEAAPETDLDLWAQVLAAAAGRRLEVVRGPAGPDTPLAFAAAWAEHAMDRAKARGAFSTAIPRANLAALKLATGA